MRRHLALVAALLVAAGSRLPAQREPVLGAYMGHGISHQLAVWRARTIRFVRSGTGEVILDFRGRRVNSATANDAVLPARAFNGNHLRVPVRWLKPGQNTIEISFVSEIAPTGASIIKVHDPAVAQMRTLLTADSAAGEPVRDPTR